MPLEGYRVLDFSRYGPGPYCSMLLGDLGADVIVVDDGTTAGERGRRAVEHSSNADLTQPLEFMRRNARRIALNLKQPDGQHIVGKLIAQADVLIESFRPGVAARLGFGSEVIRERYPGLIYCSISGYGQSGPYREWPGHDINYLALGGLLDLTGEPNRPPSIPGTLVADLAGGGLPATVAILGALLARERSGEGQYIDVSLQEGVAGLLSPILALTLTGWQVGRGTSVLTGGAPWYRTYQTEDGRYLAVGAIEPWLYAKLCRLLGHDEWIAMQYDETEWPVIASRMAAIFAGQPLQHWRETLEPAGVCVTGVQTVNELVNDPQLAARETFASGEVSATNLRTLPLMSGTPLAKPRPASEPGADAASILTELGLSLDEQRRLQADGGVGS